MPSAPTTRTPPNAAAKLARELVERRVGRLPVWVMVTQLFIGAGWLRAAAEKVIEPSWWSGAELRDFLASTSELALPWYQPFIETIVAPGAILIALVVMLGQLFAGLSLVTGRRLGLGLGTGVFLNLHFLAAGAVNPSAFYLLAQGCVALWMVERHLGSDEVRRRLGVGAMVATFVAGLSLPSIATLHPAEVIDDPAAMFAFLGVLVTMACLLLLNDKTDQATEESPNPNPRELAVG